MTWWEDNGVTPGPDPPKDVMSIALVLYQAGKRPWTIRMVVSWDQFGAVNKYGFTAEEIQSFVFVEGKP